MNSISETLNSFLNLIRGKVPGGPNSRFKSWEYCHQAFLDAKQRKEQGLEINYDLLALHLSFYLASWGMYRGSSFILQRDYKTHTPIAQIVLKDKYLDLWDFDPVGEPEEQLISVAQLAFEALCEIENGYGPIPERNIIDEADGDEDGNNQKPISMTLLTKILMGTFAICPAFDRFFIDGVKCFNKNAGSRVLGSSSHYNFSEHFKEVLIKLFKFVQDHFADLDSTNGVTAFNYPRMKKLDMYLWEVGYEYGFIYVFNEQIKKLDGADNFLADDMKKQRVKTKFINQVSTFLPQNVLTAQTDRELFNNLIDAIKGRIE